MPRNLLNYLQDRLVSGHSPENALADAETRIVEEVAQGQSTAQRQAILKTWGILPLPPGHGALIPRPGDAGAPALLSLPELRVVVSHGGDPETVPTAACLRRELSGIPHPTRADVARAMRACQGRAD